MSNTRGPRRPRNKAARNKAPRPGPNSVTLDLDAIERPDPPGKFSFKHKGYTYVANDPQEIDWQKLLLAMTNPVVFFKLVLQEEDVTRFLTSLMPTWKMRILMTEYREHYGIPEPGEADALPS